MRPTVREITHAEMQRYYNDDDGVSRLDQIIRLADGMYWGGNAGHREPTNDRNLAYIFHGHGETPGVAPEDAIFEILADEGAEPPPEKLRLSTRYFASDFLKLFEGAPKNEFVRGWILKVTKNLPPEDCDTLDKLEAWMQTVTIVTTPYRAPTERRAAEPFTGIEVSVEFTGYENGSCTYSSSTQGCGDYRMTARELRELVEGEMGGGRDFDAIVYAAETEIKENAVEICEPDMDETDAGREYDNTEVNDSGIEDVDVSSRHLRARLTEWIQNNMPEAAVALEL